tara:strand:- start:1362 stop:2087 length:726 start_codon:yes stop_codon:yes gene_type:complete
MTEAYSIIPAREFLRLADCQAVIFDMDGVLADTEEFHLSAWIELVKTHSLETSCPEVKRGGVSDEMLRLIRSTFGQSNDTIIPLLWKKAGRSIGDELANLSHEKEAAYRSCARGKVQPMPGIEDFLRLLAEERIPAAIGTSGPKENVSFLLEEFSWAGLFNSLVHRERFDAGKPAPDCFLKAAEDLGSDPGRTIVFEDSLHGLEGACRGGFMPAAIASTHQPGELTSIARWVFRDFLDLSC